MSSFKFVASTTTVAPASVGNNFFEFAENGGSNDMAVDGSSVNVVFSINPEASNDKIIEELRFYGFDNGITSDNFLALNSPLTNGILVEIKSNDELFTFPVIKRTQDFESIFALGSGRSEIRIGSGDDAFFASFFPPNPFVLKPTGSFASDDYVRVIIRDNLTQVTELSLFGFGRLA